LIPVVPVVRHDRAFLYLGEAQDVLRGLRENLVDAIVTDPPAGIGFMGKDWDSDKGGRDAWVSWLAGIMSDALRVLKPGGHALVWAIPRTSHWTAYALENAGFEIRDVITHLFGTGFPKSKTDKSGMPPGQGTALKPGAEHWILCRKPLASTVAANVAQYGTGGLNIDATRIGTEMIVAHGGGRSGDRVYGNGAGIPAIAAGSNPHVGRWPANVTLQHDPRCFRCEGGACGHPCSKCGAEYGGSCGGTGDGSQCPDGERLCICPEDQRELHCVRDCPVRMLDEQSGPTGAFAPVKGTEPSNAVAYDARVFNSRERTPSKFYGDKGGASRFFYCAKPGTKERDHGCEALPVKSGGEITDRADDSAGVKNPRAGAGRGGGRRNYHPTVKSIDLMRWLCRLITPPGGIVLDPFTGSGSTGVAALAEGFDFIGCEREPEYILITKARIERAIADYPRAA
jgi:site-specific DNA-methyltransferase (adenine-specific)